MQSQGEEPKRDIPPGPPEGGEDPRTAGTKLLIELGPLAVFFAAYAMFGIKVATGVLMVASVLAIFAAQRLLGKVAPMLWATAVLVGVFGSLTFALDDPRFIKIKPTAVNLLFAIILLGGLATGRLLLKLMLGEALKLSEIGWRLLTWRWIVFFLIMAALNEVVWRSFSETAWVNFKVFGILPITLVFGASQLGLIRRHSLDEPKP